MVFMQIILYPFAFLGIWLMIDCEMSISPYVRLW
jgi:hypothetical protein